MWPDGVVVQNELAFNPSMREALPPFAAAWTEPLQRLRKRPSPATVHTPVA